MIYNQKAFSSNLEEEAEKRAYSTANLLYTAMDGQSLSLNTASKRSPRLIIGVILSVAWLLFASWLALSRASTKLIEASPYYVRENFSLTDAPRYVFSTTSK